MRNHVLPLALVAVLAVAIPLGMNHATAQPALAPQVTATADRPFPTISVDGTTEITIAPDEVWVHLGVVTFLPALDKAVADNDKRIAAVLAALKAQQIPAADMATQHMTLTETDRYEDSSRRVRGWQVTRQLVVRVRNLDKLEALLQQVIAAGATNIDQVRFTHSQMAAKKSEARVAAMKAAREKADQMAGALGQTIGRAVRIDEASQGAGPIGNSNYANELLNAGGRVLDASTVVAGRISIQVTVAVQFELL